MFRKELVWDETYMTRGSVITLEGYSPMYDKYFTGLEYTIVEARLFKLKVKAKNGKKYVIEPFDVKCGLEINFINHMPYEPKELPF